MSASIDVVVTNYGVVKMSKKTTDWLSSLDPCWRMRIGKKGRTRKQKYVIREIANIEQAIAVAARIAWHAGEDLLEF